MKTARLLFGCLFLGGLLSVSTAFSQDAPRAKFEPTAQAQFVSGQAKLELVFRDAEFSEGPALAADGSILFSDIGNRILRFDPKTMQTRVDREPSGRANGLMFDAQGRLVACEGANTGGGRRISRTRADGTVETVADRFEGRRFNSPNDLVIDPKGRIYFTDPRYVGDDPRELDFEAVFVIDPQGSVRIATREVVKPNGILMTPDMKTVYLADNDSKAEGNHLLLKFRVRDDGTLGDRSVLWDFGPNKRGIDGMTLDREGNIYATAGRGSEAGVYIFSPTGTNLAFLPTPGDPTNCIFGGEDRRTLYITAALAEAPGQPTRFGLYRIGLLKTGYHLFPAAGGP